MILLLQTSILHFRKIHWPPWLSNTSGYDIQWLRKRLKRWPPLYEVKSLPRFKQCRRDRGGFSYFQDKIIVWKEFSLHTYFLKNFGNFSTPPYLDTYLLISAIRYCGFSSNPHISPRGFYFLYAPIVCGSHECIYAVQPIYVRNNE